MMNPAAPAPASDATLAAAPPFVLVDEAWDDTDWRLAAATPAGRRTPEQSYLFAGGPRPHPWGGGAFVGFLPDGRRAYFPSEQAFRDWNAAQGGEAKPEQSPAATSLASINAGLAAQKRPGDPALEDERKEGAAPQGAAAS